MSEKYFILFYFTHRVNLSFFFFLSFYIYAFPMRIEQVLQVLRVIKM